MTVVCPSCHCMVEARKVGVVTYVIARHQGCPASGQQVTFTGVR
jgi:hypothetical protein